ncbi:MAG: hypothetical protein N2Z21_05085 [Candidatus Sumerlaeaceae bacterium]|nr:hypothetical protein [Candidatus Sumerlaeaceae bacterium]
MADAFGIILVGTAIVLVCWEVFQQRQPNRDRWFVTPRRFRRRVLVSLLLGIIGVIISLDARRLVPFTGIAGAVTYAVGLGALAILLIVLAITDFFDTMNSAARKSLADLELAMKSAKTPDDPHKDKSDNSTST